MSWWIAVVVVLLVAALAWGAIPLSKRWLRSEAARAMTQFHRQRQPLETRFLELARTLGKPRGLRWIDCDWTDSVTFARDRETGMLTAFAGLNIRFEAIEGGDMEDVAAVGTIRDAVAVFHFHRGQWGTGGKALFNMNPALAIERLVAQFEPVSVNHGPRSGQS